MDHQQIVAEHRSSAEMRNQPHKCKDCDFKVDCTVRRDDYAMSPHLAMAEHVRQDHDKLLPPARQCTGSKCRAKKRTGGRSKSKATI